MIDRITNDEFGTSAPLAQNRLLPAVVGSQRKYQIIYADPAILQTEVGGVQGYGGDDRRGL